MKKIIFFNLFCFFAFGTSVFAAREIDVKTQIQWHPAVISEALKKMDFDSVHFVHIYDYIQDEFSLEDAVQLCNWGCADSTDDEIVEAYNTASGNNSYGYDSKEYEDCLNKCQKFPKTLVEVNNEFAKKQYKK